MKPLRVERSVGKAPTGAQSFETPERKRDALRTTKYLHKSERDELLYVWGGFGSAVGCKSAMGAIINALLRAPPRQWPIWESIESEMLKKSGRMRRDKLEKILDLEGLGTRQEVRLALRDMAEAGLVELYVATDEHGMPIDLSLEREGPEMVKLVGKRDHKWPEQITREERWAREDREVEALSLGTVPCNESVGGRGMDWHDRWMHTGIHAPAAERALGTLFGRDRVLLERVYGTSARGVRFKDLFGPELAPVVPHTAVVEQARQELVEARSRERRDKLDLERARLVGVWRRNIDSAERALVLAWEADVLIARALEGVVAHEAQKAILTLEQARLAAADCLGEFRPRGLREGDDFAEMASMAIDDAKRALAFLRRVRPPRIVPDDEIASVVDTEVSSDDAMRARLDSPPAAKADRERWHEARAEFIATAKTQADKLLRNACAAYRARLR